MLIWLEMALTSHGISEALPFQEEVSRRSSQSTCLSTLSCHERSLCFTKAAGFSPKVDWFVSEFRMLALTYVHTVIPTANSCRRRGRADRPGCLLCRRCFLMTAIARRTTSIL